MNNKIESLKFCRHCRQNLERNIALDLEISLRLIFMGIFYLQLQDINLYYLYFKNRNKTKIKRTNLKEGRLLNVKSKFKRIMDSNRNINR